MSGCPLSLPKGPQKVQNSAANLVFKARKWNHVQALLQSLLGYGPSQSRLQTVNYLSQLLLWLIICPFLWSSHRVNRFQAATFFCRHTIPLIPHGKVKPLAKALSLTLLQSHAILSLLTSIERERERDRDRDTDRQTDRQRNRQTDRQTDREVCLCVCAHLLMRVHMLIVCLNVWFKILF